VAVNLFDLVESLRLAVNPPGTDLFPDATDDEFLGALINSFWELRIYNMLDAWEENASTRGGPVVFTEGIVTPLGVADVYDDPTGWATSDMGRELQQLVVLWAAWTIVLNRMGSLSTVFRAKAGPVEYETQNAATVLKTVLDALKKRIDDAIFGLEQTADTIVFDGMIERTYAVANGETWWIKA
jgi:hypothetical protein